jgi:hypothetical protein
VTLLSRITLQKEKFGFCPEFTAKIGLLGAGVWEWEGSEGNN